MKPAIHLVLPAALLTFAAAQAQATSPQQNPRQQPAQQAPAPTPASSEQTTRCDGTAGKVLTAMNKGDFDGATKSFDPKLKATGDTLQKAWGNLTGKFGKAKTIGNASQGQQVKGYTVVLVPMQFEKGRVGAQAACRPDGKLVMLQFGTMPGTAAPKS